MQEENTTIKPMLAKKYEGENPKGWLMSEKLDGVRAIWDGRSLKSRNGNIFRAPEWFLRKLPKDTILDGELWEGRGQFQKTVGKVRSQAGDWSGIRFMIFDVVNNQPYHQRLELLQGLRLPAVHGLCRVVEQTPCTSTKHLRTYESEIISRGGEGVMLRKPSSHYEHKRSSNLIKVKRYDTAEAVVEGYIDGLGRLAGRVGAMVCRWQEKTFQVGSGMDDIQRENPPEIGATIIFSFFNCTDGGIPRHPVFVGVRDYE